MRDRERARHREEGGQRRVEAAPALQNHAQNHQFFTAMSEAFDSVGLKDPGVCVCVCVCV